MIDKSKQYAKAITALVGVIIWILAQQGIIIPEAVESQIVTVIVTAGPLLIPLAVYYIPNALPPKKAAKKKKPAKKIDG